MSKISPQQSRKINISEHVTPWLTFRQSEQRIKFEEFKVTQSNTYAFLIVYVIAMVFILMAGISTWYVYPSIFSAVSLATEFVPFALGIILLAFKAVANMQININLSQELISKIIRIIESFWILSVGVAYSLLILVVVSNGQCETDDFITKQGCSLNDQQMPLDMSMVSMIIPAMFSTILKGAKWEFVCLTFVLNFISLVVCCERYHFGDSLTSILTFAPFCMVLMYENQRQSIAVFLLSQSQQNLLEENERLADETHANELRHMIGNVAHDLKTPLAAFVSGLELSTSMLCELLQSSLTAPDGQHSPLNRGLTAIQECMTNMKNVNEFMLMTINRCIDYTKASNGVKLVPRLETVSFMDAINLPMNCMRNMQGTINISLLSVPENIAANIITDKQWLQENILCLLSNAVKYSAGGAVTIAVSLQDFVPTLSQSSGSRDLLNASVAAYEGIRIEIEDSGIGIEEETMSSLFNPFKQAQRLAGGTGLGLYSLAKRIEALGGAYGVSKRRDGQQGSLFWFTIPYRPDLTSLEKGLAPHQSGKHNPLNTSADAQETQETRGAAHLNILLVDDSLSILKMTTMMLRRQGHVVTTAENGAEALRILSSQLETNQANQSGEPNTPYDIVLMDLQMPIMDGLESTHRVRKLEAAVTSAAEQCHRQSPGGQDVYSEILSPRQLIIGCSANSDNETMQAAFVAGIDAFIPKPFNIASFNETVARYSPGSGGFRKHQK